ncbi:MAG: hypothetical protein ACLTDY_08785 [Dialister invisus]|mgnify:FL=1|uniref:hypothetical protein n=1 Tax=Dialister invisus TaxID=218538 RepID=UPI00399A374C
MENQFFELPQEAEVSVKPEKIVTFEATSAKRYFALIGNNGFAVVNTPAAYFGALHELVGVECLEFFDFDSAMKFCYATFIRRYLAWHPIGLPQDIPIDMKVNMIWTITEEPPTMLWNPMLLSK